MVNRLFILINVSVAWVMALDKSMFPHGTYRKALCLRRGRLLGMEQTAYEVPNLLDRFDALPCRAAEPFAASQIL